MSREKANNLMRNTKRQTQNVQTPSRINRKHKISKQRLKWTSRTSKAQRLLQKSQSDSNTHNYTREREE